MVILPGVQQQACGSRDPVLLEFTLQRAGYGTCLCRTLKRELQLLGALLHPPAGTP